MFELLQHNGTSYELIYHFENLQEAFKEAYFLEDDIQWLYQSEDDGGFYFEGWSESFVEGPRYVIKPGGMRTALTHPEMDETPE